MAKIPAARLPRARLLDSAPPSSTGDVGHDDRGRLRAQSLKLAQANPSGGGIEIVANRDRAVHAVRVSDDGCAADESLTKATAVGSDSAQCSALGQADRVPGLECVRPHRAHSQ